MDEPKYILQTRRSIFRYWSLYVISILCMAIPTLLITLGLTGICSAVFETSNSNFLIPSAFVASCTVCFLDVHSDGEFDSFIEHKNN